MKTRLHKTADRMNSRLAAHGCADRWELETNTFSNSFGTWFFGVLGGVTSAAQMREETNRRIIATLAITDGVAAFTKTTA